MQITTKKALRESLEHLAQGAMGHCPVDFSFDGDDCYGLLATMGLEEWLKFITSAKVVYGEATTPTTFELYNLHRFEDIESAVELIWDMRIR